MSNKLWCVKISIITTAFALLTNMALAANGTWNSTAVGSNGYWTNSLNWSASPFPAGNQTATFNNSGNGSTTIDLTGLSFGVSNIVFDTFYAGPYTLGSGGANAQPLVFTNNSVLRISPTVLESQRVDALTLLGNDRAASAHTFRNDSPAATLTLAGNITTTNTSGTGGTKTLNITGAGNTTISGNIVTNGYSPLTLTDTATGTLLLTGSNRVNTVNANGGAFIFSGTNWLGTVNVNAAGPLNFAGTNLLAGKMTINGVGNSVINVTTGTLVFANGGTDNLVATQDAVINGPGDIVLSGVGTDYANNSANLGRTLTVNARLTGPSGFEMYSAAGNPTNGTFVLTALNNFALDVKFNTSHVLSVGKIGNKGSTTSNLGRGTLIDFNANNARGGVLLYTGSGETSDRILSLTYNATLDHSGTGPLKFTGTHTASGNAKTLTLQGSTEGIGEMASVIPVGSGTTTALAKNGTGTWLLTTNNLYAGTTAVSGGTLALTGAAGKINASTAYLLNGGTLLLDNAAAANNTNRLRDASAITLNGGTLLFSNDGGSATFVENAST
jgi:fibronectin-binding autotransporter adhesin